jgi:hypothetical protein
VLRNYRGTIVAYPEPTEPLGMPTPAPAAPAEGVWELASGRAAAMPHEAPKAGGRSAARRRTRASNAETEAALRQLELQLSMN